MEALEGLGSFDLGLGCSSPARPGGASPGEPRGVAHHPEGRTRPAPRLGRSARRDGAALENAHRSLRRRLARNAARQVWILAGLGLLGGVVALGLFGWTLRNVQLEREAIDRIQSELTVLVATAESDLARVRAELTAPLTGAAPEAAPEDWLAHLRSVIESSGRDTNDTAIAEHLAQLDGALDAVGELRDRCLRLGRELRRGRSGDRPDAGRGRYRAAPDPRLPGERRGAPAARARRVHPPLPGGPRPGCQCAGGTRSSAASSRAPR